MLWKALSKNVSGDISCGFKGRWDKLVNRGLYRVIRQINPHEAEEIQVASGRMSDGDAHTCAATSKVISSVFTVKQKTFQNGNFFFWLES